MNINIKKYAILIILVVASVAVKADYAKQRTIKITLKNGEVLEYYTSKINSIMFIEKTEDIIDISLLQGELQSALTDAKSSVVATSAFGYQYSNANSVDVFAGYTTVSRSDFQYGPALIHTYQWPNGYYASACNAGPTSALYNAFTYAESLGVPEYKAIAQIVYAQTALHAVNNAGCLPYYDLRNLKDSHPLNYLSQEETYNAILEDLNEAIATLKEVQPGKESLMPVEGDSYDKGDVTYAYSEYRWEKWVQLANTVKLRIAMYLSKPNPSLAKQVAIEALTDEIGVLDEDFGPAYKQGNTQHPYYQISASNDGGWADSRMNASFENILKRTGSPLIEEYFKKNLDNVTNKVDGTVTKKNADYYGIRQGTNVGIKTIGQGYYNFSEASVAFKYVRQAWVTKEEVIFLKAEAALRWGLGDAKALYEEGVRSIFAKFDISSKADAYLAQTQVVQQKKGGKYYDIDYVDILDAKNNLPGRLDICVAWDENDSEEVKLEKIITQKWISIFPNGNEAWVDYRRTGYPRLFPSVQAWQGVPSFPVELQLRRIPHDESDENIQLYDLPNIEQALSVFGMSGENSGGQRLYFEGNPAVYPWTYDEKGWFVPINFVEISGIEEEIISEGTELKLYPSPMRNHLTIEGCCVGDKIMIVDMTGRIYYSAISQSEKEIINVSSYPSGLYIVSIGENVRKVVKID
ncbi:MAG: SusD/RagB family nutrient-binding outer membrane lipoprotein [Muribaculaceae bacterium]|nr:SusD/RagB family nutrient-binding outer membrane lipoprotein [Muribaculaceae bacterium]